MCYVQEESDSEEEMVRVYYSMQEYTDLLLCFHEVFEAYATVSSEESRIQNEAHDIDTKVSI